MKSGLIQLCVVAMIATSVSVATAADQAPAAASAAKPAATTKTEVKGVLSAPAKDAAATILGVLTSKKDSKTYQLTADATVAKEVKDAVAKAATVKVTGDLSADGATIAVKSIIVEPASAAKPAAPAAK